MDVLSLGKMTIDEASWAQALGLIQKIIRCHPIYASSGVEQAQDLIFSFMKENGWGTVFQSSYGAKDIQGLDEYVNVEAFGPLYANYSHVPKRNIIGVIDGYAAGPTLFLNGHIDVDMVSSPNLWSKHEGWKSGDVIDDRLIGRGSCDMLSGLISLITVANVLNQHRDQWKGRVIVTSVVDEEIGGNGTLHALHWLKEQGYLNGEVECLIAEPSNRQICTDSLGFMHLQMLFKRHSVHMGVATKENNALWDMHQFIGRFEEILLEGAKRINPDVKTEQLIYNFGIVNGGVDSAIPISELALEGTVFFPECLNPHKLTEVIREIVEEAKIAVEIRQGDFIFKGAEFSKGKLYAALNRAPYFPGTFPSPCDARLFKRFQIPTVIFGPGNLQQAHAIDEYIDLNEVKTYMEHVLRSSLAYLSQ